MERLDVRVVLGEALVLPLVAMSLPKARKPGEVKLAIEAHQVPELARLMSFASPDDEVAVLAADVARDLLDELAHLDRVAPRLLEPVPGAWVFSRCGGDLTIELDSDRHESTIYYRRFPEETRYGWTNPGGRWWGSETRYDELGRKWSRQLGDMVMDDFGTLVVVEGGAR